MEALKREWLRFRSLPLAVQVVSWVVVSLLVVGLAAGSGEPDTDTAATRRPTMTEGTTTTEADSTTTSFITSSTTTTTNPPATGPTAAQPPGDLVSVTRIVDGDTDRTPMIGPPDLSP